MDLNPQHLRPLCKERKGSGESPLCRTWWNSVVKCSRQIPKWSCFLAVRPHAKRITSLKFSIESQSGNIALNPTWKTVSQVIRVFQKHKVGNVGIITNFVLTSNCTFLFYLHHLRLVIRNQGVHGLSTPISERNAMQLLIHLLRASHEYFLRESKFLFWT